jgi:hypothetical protein
MFITAGQTRLLLARVTVGKFNSAEDSEASPEELMDDLETHLGGLYHNYMTVRITYKHSGSLNENAAGSRGPGVVSHTTHSQTDAAVVIKRHDATSAWSPRSSLGASMPTLDNPLVPLIRKHFPPDKADEAIKKAIYGDDPFRCFQRPSGMGGSSEETVKPLNYALARSIASGVYTQLFQTDECMKASSTSRVPTTQANLFARLPPRTPSNELVEETDPARKIWAEMRQSSRGGRSNNHWTRSSTDRYYSMEEEHSQERTSSSSATSSTMDSTESASSIVSLRAKRECVSLERNRLIGIALKNKRSLGADTLRSIAPSITKSMKAKVAVGGLGLGVGRSWGWGQNWW